MIWLILLSLALGSFVASFAFHLDASEATSEYQLSKKRMHRNRSLIFALTLLAGAFVSWLAGVAL